MLVNKELYEHIAQRFNLMLMHLESMKIPSSIRATLKGISLHSIQHQVPTNYQTLVDKLIIMNWCVQTRTIKKLRNITPKGLWIQAPIKHANNYMLR